MGLSPTWTWSASPRPGPESRLSLHPDGFARCQGTALNIRHSARGPVSRSSVHS